MFSLKPQWMAFQLRTQKWQWFSCASEPWQSLFWRADPLFRKDGCGVRTVKWRGEEDEQQWVPLAQSSEHVNYTDPEKLMPMLLPSIFKDKAEWSFLIGTACVCTSGSGLFPHSLFLPLCRVAFLVKEHRGRLSYVQLWHMGKGILKNSNFQ